MLYETSTEYSEKLRSPQNLEKRGDTPENPFKNNADGTLLVEPSNVVCDATLSVTGMANLLSKNNKQKDLRTDLQNLTLSADEPAAVQHQRSSTAKNNRRTRTYSHVDWSTTLGMINIIFYFVCE